MKLKTGILVILIGILFIPIIEKELNIIKSTPLKGSFTKAEDIAFDQGNWFSGEFQEQKGKYLNEQIGFRDFLLRLNNQINFSLFNSGKTESTIVLEDGLLLTQDEINSFTGKNYIGDSLIQVNLRKIKSVKKFLKTKGVELMIVFAPGKTRYYKEEIPKKYKNQVFPKTNYEEYCKELIKDEIHFIDFGKWFNTSKENSQYPLFPKNGIHWTEYGKVLAADSLINYFNKNTNLQLPNFKIDTIEISDTARGSDNDLELSQNLLFDLNDQVLAYPQISFPKKSNHRIMTVGDSYAGGFYFLGINNNIFNNGQFWRYNSEIYLPRFGRWKKVYEVDALEEISKHKAVILITTEANLTRFPFGFIESMYTNYIDITSEKYISHEQIKDKEILKIIEEINQNSKWYSKIQKQAKLANRTMKEELLINAEYLYRIRNKNKE